MIDYTNVSRQYEDSLALERPTTKGIIIRASDVVPEPVEWLWHNRIPHGKLTGIIGNPDRGKSTLLLDLAARVSTGTPMPDGAPVEAAGVVILSAEDGAAESDDRHSDDALRALIGSGPGNGCGSADRGSGDADARPDRTQNAALVHGTTGDSGGGIGPVR